MSGHCTDWEPDEEYRSVRDSVARLFGVEPYRLIGRSRKHALVTFRHASIWVVSECFPEISSSRIGLLYGGRDHSSILHARATVEKRRRSEPDFRLLLDDLVAWFGRGGVSRDRVEAARRRLSSVRNRIIEEGLSEQELKRRKRARETHEEVSLRRVKARNDFGEVQFDARRGRIGDRLGDAISREGLVCR